jgi:putative RecB family exonuclease
VIPRLLQLIYLGDGKLIRNNPTLADLESTEKTLMRIAREINISIEKDFWPPNPTKLCDWCFFKNICPAHAD